MPYHLLTGATGLLGSYLLREFARAERPVAVVVRSAHRESARQRVENIMVRWEKELGYLLPRPVVFEGDICKPNLGLDSDAIHWLSQNCESVVHSAASLTFQPDPRRGEPERTNVEGTRNVLEFCRTTGLRKFHYVSTAFICGLRTGRVLETEVDLGQQYGNVYEKSKITAEKMVRAAEGIDPPTIYRPATIVGDSRTGYTTTYHGIYAPLKLAAAVADKVDLNLKWGESLMRLLGLSGQERKNLVPVDWVASVIAYLHAHPEHHGKTYHLAPRTPVRVGVMTDVMQETLREAIEKPGRRRVEVPPDQPQINTDDFALFFRAQMEVYKSHWRDDPEFDLTNTLSAAGHMPPPEVDRAMLRRICTFALEANFGWPKPSPVLPEFDVHEHLRPLIQGGSRPPRRNGAEGGVGLQVNGPGGGQWELFLDGSHVVRARQGIGAGCATRLYLNSKTFQRLVDRRTTASRAVSAGQVLMEGRAAGDRRLEAVLQSLATEVRP
ncbi:MAG: SDR family oxidoreductase [Thermoguttaceae bacterium]|jgi:thioester reductase-like protein|nr:SDR family oxidoreductase [Thermoguttaceae bacterium]